MTLYKSLQFNHKIAHYTTIYVVRSRYITGVGALFTLIMGPYSGAQFVAATMETDFYTTASLSLLVFIASLLMVISCHKRMVSRIWFMTGFTWVLTGYVIYLRKDFTEKPAEWLYVASVSLESFMNVNETQNDYLFLDSVDCVRCNEHPHPLHRPLDSGPGLMKGEYLVKIMSSLDCDQVKSVFLTVPKMFESMLSSNSWCH